MSRLCVIRWINDLGQTTADLEPAVGFVRIFKHTEPDLVTREPRVVDASKWYPICSEHKKRLSGKGMHYWEFKETLDPGDEEFKV